MSRGRRERTGRDYVRERREREREGRRGGEGNRETEKGRGGIPDLRVIACSCLCFAFWVFDSLANTYIKHQFLIFVCFFGVFFFSFLFY